MITRAAIWRETLSLGRSAMAIERGPSSRPVADRFGSQASRERPFAAPPGGLICNDSVQRRRSPHPEGPLLADRKRPIWSRRPGNTTGQPAWAARCSFSCRPLRSLRERH